VFACPCYLFASIALARGRLSKEVLAPECDQVELEHACRLRDVTPSNPHMRWTVSRSSLISRRYASLHLRLQNLLPHQRCVTIPNDPPQ
jgi:hypothetical protein